MKNRLAIVKNVLALQLAFESLMERDSGVPGMGLVHGFTGAGKTTAIAWLVNRVRGVYVRANATWTPTSMLGALMKEFGAQPLRYGSAAMVAYITESVAATGRPVFVDEADYLFQNLKMLETLRDIHDATGVPIVLVGMEGIERKIVHRKQLSRRISQWVEFLPSDLEDARTLSEAVCDVGIGEDLLKSIHDEAKGNIGLMTVGLARVEARAKANRWQTVGLEQWGDRQLFLSRASNARTAA